MSKDLKYVTFNEIDLSNNFFDSLKEDYQEFEEWFLRKKDNYAYIQYGNKGQIEGFLYFKIETEKVDDVIPKIYADRILKIGTFKINPHGTRLGERFIKKSLDYAISQKISLCYVTLFEKHEALIDLFQTYGFVEYGKKISKNGTEKVLIKDLSNISGNLYFDYPLISIKQAKKYILSIYPNYHSVMFPDSILRTESVDILEDVTVTNSINKTYVARMKKLYLLKHGDIVVIYRTADEGKNAEYSSVVTSICVITDIKEQNEFCNFDDFYTYASKYSIFDKDDLFYWYNRGGCYAIQMTYNAALTKRTTRHDLIESIGLPRDEYWGFFKISDKQFKDILKKGRVYDNIIME